MHAFSADRKEGADVGAEPSYNVQLLSRMYCPGVRSSIKCVSACGITCVGQPTVERHTRVSQQNDQQRHESSADYKIAANVDHCKFGLEQSGWSACVHHQRADISGASGIKFQNTGAPKLLVALTAALSLQTSQDLFPLLLLVGEACNGPAAHGSTELLFASAMSPLREAAEKLTTLTELILNLLQQLGALCSEQTRKSTVISGKVNHQEPKQEVKSGLIGLMFSILPAHLCPKYQIAMGIPRAPCPGMSKTMKCKILNCNRHTQGHMRSPAFPAWQPAWHCSYAQTSSSASLPSWHQQLQLMAGDSRYLYMSLSKGLTELNCCCVHQCLHSLV